MRSQSERAKGKLKKFMPGKTDEEREAMFTVLLRDATSIQILNLCLDAELKRKTSLRGLNGLINLTVGKLSKKKILPPKEQPNSNYHKLWAIVDGAVRDAFVHHPDYLTAAGQNAGRMSITKRVVGAVLGYAEEAEGRESD